MVVGNVYRTFGQQLSMHCFFPYADPASPAAACFEEFYAVRATLHATRPGFPGLEITNMVP